MELATAWLPSLLASPPGWPGQEHAGGQGSEAPPPGGHGRVLLVEGGLYGRGMCLSKGCSKLLWNVTEGGDAELECLSKLNRLPPVGVVNRPRSAGSRRVQGWAGAGRTKARGWLGAAAGSRGPGRPPGVWWPTLLRLCSCSRGLGSGAVLGGGGGGTAFLHVPMAGVLLVWLRGWAWL